MAQVQPNEPQEHSENPQKQTVKKFIRYDSIYIVS